MHHYVCICMECRRIRRARAGQIGEPQREIEVPEPTPIEEPVPEPAEEPVPA